MSEPQKDPERKSQPAFDWLDVILVFLTICAGFFVAGKLDVSDKSRIFKYAMGGVVLLVIVARRAVIGPPRVVAVRAGASALGFLSAACMLFGLVIASFGGYMLYEEAATPLPEPTKIDRDAIERQIAIPGLGRRCTRDGKTLTGRACMTPEERAAEAAEDDKRQKEELAHWEAEKKDRMGRFWKIAGFGAALMLAGIGLDILRTRRDAVPPG